jgi:cell division protein FtsA
MIEIGGDSGDWEKDRRTITRAELIGIMRPRVEEILEEVRARLDAAGFRPSAQPADRADRRRQPDPGLDGLARASWASRCGWAARSACTACRRPPPGRRFRRSSACAMFAATRRTNRN